MGSKMNPVVGPIPGEDHALSTTAPRQLLFEHHTTEYNYENITLYVPIISKKVFVQ
jgi:hypothetical protein